MKVVCHQNMSSPLRNPSLSPLLFCTWQKHVKKCNTEWPPVLYERKWAHVRCFQSRLRSVYYLWFYLVESTNLVYIKLWSPIQRVNLSLCTCIIYCTCVIERVSQTCISVIGSHQSLWAVPLHWAMATANWRECIWWKQKRVLPVSWWSQETCKTDLFLRPSCT